MYPEQPPHQLDVYRAAVGMARLYGDRLAPSRVYRSGEDYLPTSGKVIAGEEMGNATAAILDAVWAGGSYTAEFERALAKYVGSRTRSAVFCNSGSSANLLAMQTLNSRTMRAKDNRRSGGRVVTAAVGFPTTLNPILQSGFTPAFVDVEVDTLVPTPEALEEACSEDTVAIFTAHTLGNPWDVLAVRSWADSRGIITVEDNCDALGSTLGGRRTGGIGAMGTQSFYPAHQITTGEGGAVICSTGALALAVRRLRDWGRDCWCEPGKDNTCGRRFDWKFPNLPPRYDHKYVYSEVGYNLKATDIQAAIGLAQMAALDAFVLARKQNFATLWNGLSDMQDIFILPRATEGADPAWFGFPITIRPESKVSRAKFVAYLEKNKIGTRLVFGGNLVRQPAYRERGLLRKAGALPNADLVARQSLWVGLWPGLSTANMEYVVERIHAPFRSRGGLTK